MKSMQKSGQRSATILLNGGVGVCVVQRVTPASILPVRICLETKISSGLTFMSVF